MAGENHLTDDVAMPILLYGRKKQVTYHIVKIESFTNYEWCT